LARFPETAIWRVDLGEVFNAAGDVSGALAQFGEAVKIDPSIRATVQFRCGYTLLTHGRAAEAEQKFRQALDANPHMAKAQNCLGVILLNQQKTAEAKQAFQRALEADPALFTAPATSPRYWMTKANCRRNWKHSGRPSKRIPTT